MSDPALIGELWRFCVAADHVDGVFLVRDPHGLPSAWLEMQAAGPNRWELTLRVEPGRYRFRYYTSERGVIFNCGTVGLTAGLLSPRDPAVFFDDPAPPRLVTLASAAAAFLSHPKAVESALR